MLLELVSADFYSIDNIEAKNMEYLKNLLAQVLEVLHEDDIDLFFSWLHGYPREFFVKVFLLENVEVELQRLANEIRASLKIETSIPLPMPK